MAMTSTAHPDLPSRGSALDRAIPLVARRLGSYGEPLVGAVATDRACALLAHVAAGMNPSDAGDDVLRAHVRDRAARRLLGRAAAAILLAIEDAWSDAALEALATGCVVQVEVEVPADVEDPTVIRGRACESHRGLMETRARPERIAPGRWLVRMRPWGTHC